jgi:hypothetical protein
VTVVDSDGVSCSFSALDPTSGLCPPPSASTTTTTTTTTTTSVGPPQVDCPLNATTGAVENNQNPTWCFWTGGPEDGSNNLPPNPQAGAYDSQFGCTWARRRQGQRGHRGGVHVPVSLTTLR